MYLVLYQDGSAYVTISLEPQVRDIVESGKTDDMSKLPDEFGIVDIFTITPPGLYEVHIRGCFVERFEMGRGFIPVAGIGC